MATKEQNRAASAGYAREANRREGTPMPSHLRDVTPSFGPGSNSGGGTGSFGLPDPASGRLTGIGGARGGLLDMLTGGYTSVGDMFNGGGPGQAGDRFEGGPRSAILNMLGIRPMGYADRLAQQAQAQPAAAPMPQTMPRPMAQPAPAPAMPNSPFMMAGGPITQSTLPPVGQMTNEQLMQIIQQALGQAPSAIGYGPR